MYSCTMRKSTPVTDERSKRISNSQRKKQDSKKSNLRNMSSDFEKENDKNTKNKNMNGQKEDVENDLAKEDVTVNKSRVETDAVSPLTDKTLSVSDISKEPPTSPKRVSSSPVKKSSGQQTKKKSSKQTPENTKRPTSAPAPLSKVNSVRSERLTRNDGSAHNRKKSKKITSKKVECNDGIKNGCIKNDPSKNKAMTIKDTPIISIEDGKSNEKPAEESKCKKEVDKIVNENDAKEVDENSKSQNNTCNKNLGEESKEKIIIQITKEDDLEKGKLKVHKQKNVDSSDSPVGTPRPPIDGTRRSSSALSRIRLTTSTIKDVVSSQNGVPDYAVNGYRVVTSKRVQNGGRLSQSDSISEFEVLWKNFIYLNLILNSEGTVKTTSDKKFESLTEICEAISKEKLDLSDHHTTFLIAAAKEGEKLLREHLVCDKVELEKALLADNRFSLSGQVDYYCFGKDCLENKHRTFSLIKCCSEKHLPSTYALELFLYAVTMDISTAYILTLHIKERMVALYELKFKFDKLRDFNKGITLKMICENFYKNWYQHADCKLVFKDAKDL